jgi:hypothetical protein
MPPYQQIESVHRNKDHIDNHELDNRAQATAPHFKPSKKLLDKAKKQELRVYGASVQEPDEGQAIRYASKYSSLARGPVKRYRKKVPLD